MCLFEREFKVSITLLILFVTSFVAVGGDFPDKGKFSINLKSQSIILGPKIRLGNVSQVVIPNAEEKRKIAVIVLGDAPPPGESSDISLSYIKKCLKVNGFENYVEVIKGPKVIRITTAHIEIDKVFLQEELAYDMNRMKKSGFPGFLACFFC